MISEIIIEIIKAIPPGKVMSYGQVAASAGLVNSARTVARILHSSSRKHHLPWWRVVRSNGEIALPEEAGGTLQMELLLSEGVAFKSKHVVDLDLCRFPH
ncbi:MAG: MGMT family protein [Candidatus Cloacimonas sp.]|nr:MGMT family protein [Candidatus Cloacimonas sp.]